MDIQVKNIDHLGIVAGIVDQIGLVEEIDRHIKKHPQQLISTGQVVKAMILNGLGFLSASLYLFKEFFVGKATEHLLGEGILPENLNDDRIGRALDSLWNYGLTPMFTNIASLAQRQFQIGVTRTELPIDPADPGTGESSDQLQSTSACETAAIGSRRWREAEDCAAADRDPRGPIRGDRHPATTGAVSGGAARYRHPVSHERAAARPGDGIAQGEHPLRVDRWHVLL